MLSSPGGRWANCPFNEFSDGGSKNYGLTTWTLVVWPPSKAIASLQGLWRRRNGGEQEAAHVGRDYNIHL
jgi:hypothetical protein